mmetsp:Transcript_5937/g.14108  ORF Transcript_5937/g.14108 Transcript_5937/m.14108 type:complete len:640 (-) Transcript_5937:72-1991(-)
MGKSALEEEYEAKDAGVKVKPRACTDLCCLIILFAYMLGMAYVMTFSLANGNLDILTHGYDWEGRVCGVDNGVEELPLLYWCVEGGTKVSDGICVSECPTGTDTMHECPGPAEHETQVVAQSDGSTNVVVSVTRNLKNQTDIPTMEVLSMYCFPSENKAIVGQILKQAGLDGSTQKLVMGLHGVASSKKFLVGVMIFAIIAGYAFLFFLRVVVKPLIYAIGLAMWLALLAASIYFILIASGKEDLENPWDRVLVSAEDQQKAGIWTAGGLLVLFLLFSCFMVVAHRAVKITCASIEEACAALFKMPTLLLQPLLDTCLRVAAITFGIYGLAVVCSLGKVTTSNAFVDPETGISISGLQRHLTLENWQWGMVAYWLFGAVWTVEILGALGQYAISHAMVVSSLLSGSRGHCFPLLRGYGNGIIFHLGTVAFGAFLLGVMRIITGAMAFIAKQTSDKDGGNKIAKLLCCCCTCCMACLQKVLEMLNEMVYTDVAIRGCNYPVAAKNVIKMLATDLDVWALVHGSTRIVRVLGEFAIGAGGTFVCYLLLTNPAIASRASEVLSQVQGASDMLYTSDTDGTLVASAVICFGVATAFMTIFDHAADALMYCLLYKRDNNVDCEVPESFKLAGVAPAGYQKYPDK